MMMQMMIMIMKPAHNPTTDEDDVKDEPPVETAVVGTKEDSEDEPPVETAGVEPLDDENTNNQPVLECEINAKYGPCTEQYDMHKRKVRDYSHLLVTKNNDGMKRNYCECLHEEDDKGPRCPGRLPPCVC